MRKLGTYIIFLISIIAKVTAQDLKLVKTTYLANYPSASAIDFFNDRLYVIGDDAPKMMVLDTDHNIVDSLRLFNNREQRISKATKPDIESSFIIQQAGKSYLYAIGSFSTNKRNKYVTIGLSGKSPVLLKTTTAIIKKQGLAEINIEGAASIGDTILLSNRANTTNKTNYILVTKLIGTRITMEFSKKIAIALPVQKVVTGISGLHYIKEKDILLFSASTEDTPNAYSDGTIGESYIGYIRSISKKLNQSTITPDKLIPLTSYLQQSKPQKIESITAEDGNSDKLIIHLASDNDDGSSTLYKLRLEL